MAIREFGVRDLRNNTAQVFAAVRHGDEVYLTVRGERVAEVRPVEQGSAIDALIAKAALASPGDTGAFDELLAAKETDIEAQRAKDDVLWG